MSSLLLHQVFSGDTASCLRLLVLEQNQSDVERILTELQRAGITASATVIVTKSEFVATIASEQFFATLACYVLPGWTGLEALHHLRSSGDPTPVSACHRCA